MMSTTVIHDLENRKRRGLRMNIVVTALTLVSSSAVFAQLTRQVYAANAVRRSEVELPASDR